MKQLSEIWRRGIVLPLTIEKAKEMATFYVSTGSDVQYLSIENDVFFYRLWQTGIFEELNKRCNVLIDDFEEEDLQPEYLKEALSIITKYRSLVKDSQIYKFLRLFESLVKRGISLGFPVYFIL